LASAFDCTDGKVAGEAIRDVADARTNGNPMMIRKSPSQGTGQMPSLKILLHFFPHTAKQTARTDGQEMPDGQSLPPAARTLNSVKTELSHGKTT
jgi:hypothetical protein